MYFRGTDTYLDLVEGKREGPQWNANLVVLNLKGQVEADGCLEALSLTGEEVESRGDYR